MIQGDQFDQQTQEVAPGIGSQSEAAESVLGFARIADQRVEGVGDAGCGGAGHAPDPA